MTVLSLIATNDTIPQPTLRQVRSEYGLTILEAATALGCSASAVEELERALQPDRSPEDVARQYELFVGTSGVTGKNLIFGHYPLRMAREILGLSIEEMAAEFGYTAHSWKRIEASARPLRPGLLERIERRVRERFTAVCAMSQ